MEATGTGHATAIGGMAVSGALIVNGSVNMTGQYSVTRTGYREQIQRFAPPQLRGRTEELAALVAFCTSPEEAPYLWLRGPAWAGKSALLSSFALRPPEGVRVVPFFVTGRFAGQNDRIGFCDVVTEQLAALLGQPMPAQITDATREGHLLRLIDEAVQVCRENGTRLVLIVDGLDEDQGVTGHPESHSIAALLPARPQPGLRVVVTSRPHPPVPTDVPDNHPLRDPSIVRDLSTSPHAEAVRADAEREVQRLADTSGLGRDILGLITVAEGGLSERDLAELTGESTYALERKIRTASGRTFASLLSPWNKEEVYVLGHEELRSTALHVLGGRLMDDYRERLHRWADHYRDQGWPAHTSEYLLHGYFRALRIAGDLPRLVAIATDATRHHRVLRVTGGDGAAFGEVRAVQELLLEQQDPDLLAMARLAVRRDALEARNDNVPIALPALWAALGEPERADAVLNGIVTPDRHRRAFLSLLETFLLGGDFGRARALAETAVQTGLRARALADVGKALCAAGDLKGAEEVTLLVRDPRQRVSALSDMIRALAAAGEPARVAQLVENAERAALSVSRPMHRAAAMRSVANSLVDLGEDVRALNLVRTIPDLSYRARALNDLALAATLAEDQARYGALSDEATTLTYALPQPESRIRSLASLACTAATAGQFELARDLAQDATRLAQGLDTSVKRYNALVRVVAAVLAAGDPELARHLTRSITVPERRVCALLHLVKGKAISIPECVAELPGSMISLLTEGALVHFVRVAAVEMDEPALAEAFAARIVTPARRLHILLELTQRAAAKGASEHVRKLRAQVKEVSAMLHEPQERIEATVGIAHLDALLGTDNSARNIAEATEARLNNSTDDVRHQSRALLNLARAMTVAGDADRARALGRQVESLAGGIAPASERVQAQEGLIDLGISVGDFDWAGSLAQKFHEPYRRAMALVKVADAWAAIDDRRRCLGLLADVEALSGPMRDVNERSRVLTESTRILTLLGFHERAEEVAGRITDPQQQTKAFMELAQHVDERQMRRLLAKVLGTTGWAESLSKVVQLAPLLVRTIADDQLTEAAASVRAPQSSEGDSNPLRRLPEPQWRDSESSAQEG
ncbi:MULTISPECIES: NACHT domain-containing protein [Streptomyces]|uniref:NACHT domain-containing protein n=1 Tax=Streptomyces TaxID=1883 RepID=UPI00186AC624|nr:MULTISPECIES: NACHT domain-containing protein [Streptomyces]